MTSYVEAGVDIKKADEFIESVRNFAGRTSRPGSMNMFGGFGGVFDLKAAGYKDPLLVSGTDGIGTKLELLIEQEKYENAGQDLVAMCANDIIAMGAEPLFFLDYFATGELEPEITKQLIAGIASACEEAGMELIGGETAEMPGMYDPGKFDLAGFAVGAVEREDLLPKTDTMQAGDVLIALSSTGLHANGYSLVRKLMREQDKEKHSLLRLLTEPTAIYADLPFENIKGAAHITGGGIIGNLPRILPPHLSAEISWQALKDNWPPVYEWVALQELGRDELLKVFNCGAGMILVVDRDEAERVLLDLAIDYPGFVIGRLTDCHKRVNVI